MSPRWRFLAVILVAFASLPFSATEAELALVLVSAAVTFVAVLLIVA